MIIESIKGQSSHVQNLFPACILCIFAGSFVPIDLRFYNCEQNFYLWD